MINPSKLPQEIYNSLRNRGNQIEDIAKMDYKKAFDEYCKWHGLRGSWGPILREAYEALKKADKRMRVIAKSNPQISGPPDEDRKAGPGSAGSAAL